MSAQYPRNKYELTRAADRHGRLRAMLGEWKEPCAPAAAEDKREHLVVHGHSGGKWYTEFV